MKKLAALFLTAALMLSLLGCENGDYINSNRTVTGGSETVNENVNLKSVDITEGDELTISLFFLSGSVLAGRAESKLSALPKYEIYFEQSPMRLVVRIFNIDYYDYSFASENISAGIVSGAFKVVPASQNYIELYFQLTCKVVFKVEEDTDTLIIKLKNNGEMKSTYHVVANSFLSYQEGTFPSDLNYSPVLCSDKESVILISQPFDSYAKAQKYKEQTDEKLPEGSVTDVITLSGSAMPDVLLDVDVSKIISAPSAIIDGKKTVLTIALKNGRYLDENDSGILFSRSYVASEAAADDYAPPVFEKLWLNKDGQMEPLPLPAFSQITRAEFSASGKYIIILELSSENSILYSYNIETHELLNLSEEGLGNLTDAFCLDEKSDIIYCVSGTSGQKQVMKVDLNGEDLISAIEEQSTYSTKIVQKAGRLFLTDYDENGLPYIYEITSDGRNKLCPGVDFTVSDDGSKLAVVTLNAGTIEGEVMGLSQYDLASGKTQVIAENTQVQSIGYLGETLYYTTALENARDGFDFGLNAYKNDAVAEMAQLITGDFLIRQKSLYLIYYVSGTDNLPDFYITFTL